VRRHANRVEASIERLDNGLRPNPRPNPAGRAMLHVNRRPHRDLIICAIWLQSVECAVSMRHIMSGVEYTGGNEE